MKCVAAELESRGLAFEACDGGVLLREKNVRVGLVNVAQQCRRELPPRWPELVRFLFEQVLAAEREEDPIPALAADPVSARARLRLRLLADEYLRELPRDELVCAPLTSRISRCLAWDLPSTVRLVRRSDVASWDAGEESLFALALDNVRKHEPVARSERTTDRGVRVIELGGESHFAASHALLLADHLGGATSALVWIPNRHTVLFVAGAASPSDAIASVAPLAARAFERGPGSISPEPLAFRDGTLAELDAP
jgi:hypothetical protein